MTDREDDFNRTAKDSEGRKVQQELERQLRELGDTMSDSFRHGFEGRGEEIGDRVWDVGRAAVNAAGYGISEAGRAFQAGKQEYQKRAEEARSSGSASGMTDWARNFFAKKPEPTAIENLRTSAKKRHGAGVAMLATGIAFQLLADISFMPGDGFVRTVSEEYGFPFGTTKVCFDVSIVVAAILVSLCWFQEISGIREGTLLAAVLVGFIIRMLQQPLRFVKRQLVKA